jgi:hypothetical protein
MRLLGPPLLTRRGRIPSQHRHDLPSLSSRRKKAERMTSGSVCQCLLE